MSKNRVLVVGGSGYLGQHLLIGLSEIQPPPFDIAYTHHSQNPPPLLNQYLPQARSFPLDLRSGDGFDDIAAKFGQPHVVVNCAALSVPRTCEMDPTATMSINVPSALVKWLSSFTEINSLLIHLSTDQGRKLNQLSMILYISVFEGVKSFYKEEDEVIPVNVYGKSKVKAEQYISENWSNLAILRCSIIYGPQTVSPVPKFLPIQWMDSVLSKGDAVNFFYDEFRCPVYVKDVVTVIVTLTRKWISEGKQIQLLLNVGGPDRVSRTDMAEAVARTRGYNNSLIKHVSASSIDRGVKSPADISMDITKLINTLGVSPIPYNDGVKLTLAATTGP